MKYWGQNKVCYFDGLSYIELKSEGTHFSTELICETFASK
jgi:hypothetical protein